MWLKMAWKMSAWFLFAFGNVLLLVACSPLEKYTLRIPFCRTGLLFTRLVLTRMGGKRNGEGGAGLFSLASLLSLSSHSF